MYFFSPTILFDILKIECCFETDGTTICVVLASLLVIMHVRSVSFYLWILVVMFP